LLNPLQSEQQPLALVVGGVAMKPGIKSLVCAAACLSGFGLCLIFGGCHARSSGGKGAAVQPRYISIATSSAGGAFSVIGTAMADIINRNIPELSANIEITGGSSENILLAEAGNVELAMTASDVLSLALEGKGSFEGKQVQSVLGVMGGHMTTTQVYVLRDGPVKTYADLKNKKIGVGPPGSVAGDAMKTIMDAYGFAINRDWQPEYLAHGDAAEALVDGNIDAVIIMSTLPAAPVSSAAAAKPLRLLDLDAAMLEKLLTENPFYIKASIPANIYTGQTDPVNHTFGSVTMMVANSNISENDIYQVVKHLLENNEILTRAYPQCNEWNKENVTRGFDGLLAMHPGTVKYLREIGLR
jgi:TRAP transporter TAXI family solute receptor